MDKEQIKRIKKYIGNFELTFKKIKTKNLGSDVKDVLELSEKYYLDAKFYFNKNDYFTSLVCIVYAEGLLDAIHFMKKINFECSFKKPTEKKRVLIAGTFDIIHPGHLWFIKKASEYGELTVIVARDKNVTKIKGRRPIIPEEQRLEVIKGLKYIDHAILGSEKEDILQVVEKLKPDVLILGPDQDFIQVEEIQNKLKARGLAVKVIKLKDKFKGTKFYKTSQIVNEIIKRTNLNSSK